MSYRQLHVLGIAVVLLVMVVGCGGPAATPMPPAATPASSEAAAASPAATPVPPAATPVPPAAAPTSMPEPTPLPALFSAYQDKKIGYINASGTLVVPLQYDDGGRFREGLAAVKVGSLWGYIDGTGTMVIQPQFDDVAPFSEGLAAVKAGSVWGYVDGSGQMAIKPQFDDASSFSEGLAAVQVGSLWGYIDATGTLAIQPSFGRAFRFSGGRARISKDDQYGYIDSTGAVVIAPTYDDASDFSEELAQVMKCTPQKTCKTATFSGEWGTITLKTGGEFSYIDPAGKAALPLMFDDAGDFAEGLAPVKIGEKWGYVDKAGAIAIPMQFDAAHSFSEGLAGVGVGRGVDQEWGYIDRTGAMVIEPQFLLDGSFSQGLAQVQLEDESGGLAFAYINKAGEYVWNGSTPTQPSAEATAVPEVTLPPIPDEFPTTNQAECEWQKQIVGSWSRKLDDGSTETAIFKPDHTLSLTNGDKPNEVRVGTYICEQGGTLKIFTQAYVDGKPEWTIFLGKIEITFPSSDTLKMDVKTANEVWTYARVK